MMVHVYGIENVATLSEAVKAVTETAGKNATDVDQRGRFPEEAIRELARRGLLSLAIPSTDGGLGMGPREFAVVTEELAQACASTAMVYVMHVVATQAIVNSGNFPERTLLRKISQGGHLTTLALSEKGSRSLFWLPVSGLVEQNGRLFVTAEKSWVTSANFADFYVSTAQRPGAESPLESTLYLVRRPHDKVKVTASYNGLGLRGNDSSPVSIDGYEVTEQDLLSKHGEGLQHMLQVILPWFAVGTAAMAHGLCLAVVGATTSHLTNARFEVGDSALRDLPNLRARIAEMSIRTEQSRALLGHTLDHLEQPSELTPLRVLQSRAAALKAACEVTDLAMQTCGGAAFSRHLAVERYFRDSRAGWVMAPTSDHLLDFVGRALTGLPLV